jgi:hypothetical protein
MDLLGLRLTETYQVYRRDAALIEEPLGDETISPKAWRRGSAGSE